VSSDKTAEDLKKAAEMFRRATAEEASEEEETNGDRGNESV
jgi:hypothetical protein